MRRVAIDANLLLLLVVGAVAPDFVARHKRLKSFDYDDYQLLCSIIADAEAIVSTPNVATEVANIVGFGVHEPLRSALFARLEAWLPTLLEHYQATSLAVAEPEFIRLGLSDCAWFGCVDRETELITADLELYLAALQRGLTVTNFAHLRHERV
jgi:hypothetical protein